MKRIVICMEGTGADELRRQVSNIRMTYLATKDQPNQYAWYDRGVGNGSTKEKIWGGATGDGLTLNIEQAYLQLGQHYNECDEIFLFGFSRGAYTVRSLGGLIRNIGLLRRDRAGALAVGFEMYTDKRCGPDSVTARKFRATNSNEVTIKFMGVYDTVGSVGQIQKLWVKTSREEKDWYEIWGFHDYRLSSLVENGYQALAIDEKPRPFGPQIWNDPKVQREWPEEANERCMDLEQSYPQFFSEDPIEPTQAELDADKLKRENQVIDQQWFRGCHTDIGGGNHPPGLSNSTLNWMIEAASNVGLQVDDTYLLTNANSLVEKKINESFKFPYKLLGKVNREIGNRSPNTESLHSSVDQFETDYPEQNKDIPQNLKDFRNRT
ncbi:MAG: DUF2235 domain-containing protein [Bacteroidota bacterium]